METEGRTRVATDLQFIGGRRVRPLTSASPFRRTHPSLNLSYVTTMSHASTQKRDSLLCALAERFAVFFLRIDIPSSAMTARMSSIRDSSVGTPTTRSDMPLPRLSKRSRRPERGEPAQERRLRRDLPSQLHMEGQHGDEDQVERSLAHYLVGDVHIAAARVLRFGRLQSEVLDRA